MDSSKNLNLNFDFSNHNLEKNIDTNIDYSFPSTPVMKDLDMNKPSVSYYQSKNSKELINFDKSNQNLTETQNNTALATNDNEINDNIQPRIVNVVSTVSLDCQLNLRDLALKLQNAEYNPIRINALIIRLKSPKTVALVFSNGKMVVVGANDEDNSKKAARSYAKDIKRLGYDVKFRDFKIQNVVGTCGVNFEIRLNQLSLKLNLNNSNSCSYEPDLFPGLIYHMHEPKLSLLIFKSGKIVFVGAKERSQIFLALDKILPLLKQYKKIE